MSLISSLKVHNARFAELQPKKYPPKLIKAIAHYCFLFFEQYQNIYRGAHKNEDGTNYGYVMPTVGPSMYHESLLLYQGGRMPNHGGYDDWDKYDYWNNPFNWGNYYIYADWHQSLKKIRKGTIKHKWYYGFAAYNNPTLYVLDISFTGNWECVRTVTTKNNKTITTFTYYPIFSTKLYSASYEASMDSDGFTYFDSIDGTPIYYTLLQKSTDPETKIDTYTYLSEAHSGAFFSGNPLDFPDLTGRKLDVIKTGYNVDFEGLPISGENGHVILKEGKLQIPILVTDTTAEIPAEENAKYINTVYDYPSTTYDGEVETDPTPPTLIYPSSLIVDPEKHTYMCLTDKEVFDTDATSANHFFYYHKIDNNTYEEIEIKNFHMISIIGAGNEFVQEAYSHSALAPDAFTYLPIVPDIIKKLSIIECMYIYQLSLKQTWRYWTYQEVSWWCRHRAIVIGIGIIIVVTIITFGTCTQLAAAAVITMTQAIIITAVTFGLMLTSLLLPDSQSSLKQALNFAAMAITTAVTAGAAVLVEGAAFLSLEVLVPIICNIGSFVLDIVYNMKNSAVQGQQASNNSAYAYANQELSNKQNLLEEGASASPNSLASTYSNNVMVGLNCDEVTDLMVSSNYVGDLVYASMDLDLDVFRKVTNGTGYGLYNFEKLWNEGSL